MAMETENLKKPEKERATGKTSGQSMNPIWRHRLARRPTNHHPPSNSPFPHSRLQPPSSIYKHQDVHAQQHQTQYALASGGGHRARGEGGGEGRT
jgi:hypothetical protein